MSRIRAISPDNYDRHLIHGDERAWTETNCYVDVLIELLHSFGHDPIAALPFSLRIDFEGDQWTFFKFAHADLLTLYGWDIQELNPWQSLAQHIAEQIARQRPVLVEVDAHYLPDTASSSYGREHVKTTIAINEIDISARKLGYFHGQGYYQLGEPDFTRLFQLDGQAPAGALPPYIEYVRLWQTAALGADKLIESSLLAMKSHLKLLPERNPFAAFRARYQQDLDWLMSEPIEMFHRYSFATHRQYGACFELAETYLRWLANQGINGVVSAADEFGDIARTAKTYQFQLARAVARGRAVPLEPLDRMAERWDSATQQLVARFA